MLVFVAVAVAFLVITGCCVQAVLQAQLAPRLGPAVPTVGPLVSVIIPARNEAARIGTCLAGLAAQQYCHFELIVIDDHSTDATTALVSSYRDRLPQLHLLTSASLPDGWAGKCWACWQAAQQAQGEWLLFLDADVVPQPDLLGALIANAAQADATTLLPLQRFGSLIERLVIPAFHTILYGVYPLDQVSNQRTAIAFFNGPAIFIRRAVYAATDGHRSVRASVLEDADYGQVVKEAGYRIFAADAPDLITIRMYNGWASLCEGLGKNAVAGFRSGGARSALVGLGQSLIAFGPSYLLLAGVIAWLLHATPVALVIFAHGLVLQALTLGVTGWLFRRRHRIAPLWALGYPLGLAIYFALTLYGLVRVRSGRGVRWKGRVLPGR